MTKLKSKDLCEARIAKYKASGESARVWCAENNVNFSQLYYWLKIEHISDEQPLWLPVEIEEQFVEATLCGRVGKASVDFYARDAIIAVGYRVDSKKATRFRQWATITLHEYIQKGLVLNDEVMKNGKPFGKEYFDELMQRIREIRVNERRAYQKIVDVFEQCSYDYDQDSNLTRGFLPLFRTSPTMP